jgi:glycyl-tRNA synthetase beta chain
MKAAIGLKDALLEIGVEPLPARFVAPALAQLESHAKKLLAESRLSYKSVRAVGTLRRLAVIVEGLAPKSEPLSKTVLGPPAKLLKDEKGEFTLQSKGFAKAQGVAPEDLLTAPSPRGELMVAKVTIPGESAPDILPAVFKSLISSLRFPKDMVWDYSGFRFARPIRSLVALVGQRIVPVELAGVKSGRNSPGASEFAKPIPIKDAARYVQALEAKLIVVDPAKRRELLDRALAKAAAAEGVSLDSDPGLVEKTSFLVEYPTVIAGRFDERFRVLPSELVAMTLKKELDFFPLWVPDRAKLSEKFIGVKDGASENLKVIREGYERVVTARLDDAVFYYARDNKTSIEQLREKLKGRLYQKDLGTLYDKSERVRELAASLCEQIRQDYELDEPAVGRIAALAYADLASEVVGAFPELQGRMGGLYATANGETDAVGLGIQQFYFPEAARSDLPMQDEACIASLAGKLDTIAGDFAVGLIPTGSEDPHGLRRQALGAWRIARERGLPLSISQAIVKAITLQPPPTTVSTLAPQIEDFIWQRAEGSLLEEGYAVDEIRAVREGGLWNVPRTVLRLRALHSVRPQPEFAALAAAYKRANNILRQNSQGPASLENGVVVRTELLTDGAERSLLERLQRTEGEVRLKLQNGEFEDSLRKMVGLKPAVDEFFEKVLVMAEDAAVRQNRLSLLAHLVGLFRSVADLSQLQG